MLCAFYIFETSLKMRVFDNKIREHAATYMNEFRFIMRPLVYKASVLSTTQQQLRGTLGPGLGTNHGFITENGPKSQPRENLWIPWNVYKTRKC